ncbi:aldehyde dehydrogenase family protein [Janibacter sp. UYMM211]|uniref:aldehyde dehydrogenase family protein n=1 Tax=Janibacter sp. UYMM211 TaxID=3156342 RepID=UPI0033989495
MTRLKGNFIGGEWVWPGSGASFERTNPARPDELVSMAPCSSAADVDEAITHLAQHRHEWAATAPEKRADVLVAAADILAAQAEELAVELVREEGKTLAEARMEATRTPQNLRFFAGEALRMTGETFPTGDGSLVFTRRGPVGVVAAITPWNFPLNIPSRKLGPALAAGNAVVFKPSEITPLMGQRLVEALVQAGVPGGALALVHGHAEVGRAMVANDDVHAVTFTGSTAVGTAIHEVSGPEVRTQLEMGGKNALVVLDTSDLDRAVGIIAKGAFGLSGQACTGTSRVVVHEAVADELVRRLAEVAEAARVGNGLDDGVTFGPLANAAQVDKFQHYVDGAAAEGARLVTPGDERAEPAGGGYFVRPTIFRDVDPLSALAQEEIFSPVLAFITVGSYDEAVRVVNNTEYGLSAGLVTSDIGQAIRFADDVETGLVKVNQATNGMAMNAPFGGMKNSSTQTFKEQAGASMMTFYTTDKTVYFTP